ncbi:IS66 family insertion sequence element accessory protein TnpA [Pseudobacteroides sp.]|uniref:IS66 family insertion sequence element accessory protein TnpA n=1 Tax=Pseudobacteroides sp. TaxID=1968840 RepID=UPI0039C9D6B0
MDKITDAKTEFRLKQWTQIVQACQSSSMTVVGWCEQNNVKIKSYYYWLHCSPEK